MGQLISLRRRSCCWSLALPPSQRLGRFGFDCMRCLRGSRSITRIHSWTIIASPPDDGPFGTRDLIGPDGSVVVVLVASVGDNGIMLVVEK